MSYESSEVEDELTSMQGTSDMESSQKPKQKSVLQRRDVIEGSPSKPSTSAASHDKPAEKGSKHCI
jgi:hypothetical protein